MTLPSFWPNISAEREDQFAALMTAKARQLGMRGTNFHNASGLPDPQQITTARDMALLGMSLRRHYPQQYYYFATQDFVYNGKLIRGHNRVLAQLNGADGIKTGYVRASGFNIVTSDQRQWPPARGRGHGRQHGKKPRRTGCQSGERLPTPSCLAFLIE